MHVLQPSRCVLLLTAVLAISSGAFAQRFHATVVATRLDQPVGIACPPGDTRRVFFIEKTGLIRLVEDGVVLDEPFLDLAPIVYFGDEGGLLGMAFHPRFAENGRFYVSYTDQLGASVVREYTAHLGAYSADPASFVTIFGPYSHGSPTSGGHNGGGIQFGLDGKLYLMIGDGSLPQNAQDMTSYLGKALRIDVDNPPTYVPADNPFADPNDGVLDLIWASGLRNPWRFSFDRASGDLYIGDVGNNDEEELDFQPASSGHPGDPTYFGGRNYGWPCMEGDACYVPVPGCTCFGSTLTPPVQSYRHGSGIHCIIGGFVYRGGAMPSLEGKYLWADFNSAGRVFALRCNGGVVTDFEEITQELNPITQPFSGNITGSITSFGEDARGALYMTTIAAPGYLPPGGMLLRIDEGPPPCIAPYPASCPATPNSTGAPAHLTYRGTACLSINDLELVATQCPAHAAGFFFYGPHGVIHPFGDGYQCVANPFVRMPMTTTNDRNQASVTFDALASPIPITAGQSLYFQFLFRDNGSGASSFNLSDSLRVIFGP
jgi:glucose/arabinose dehydrogenase